MIGAGTFFFFLKLNNPFWVCSGQRVGGAHGGSSIRSSVSKAPCTVDASLAGEEMGGAMEFDRFFLNNDENLFRFVGD